MGNNYLFKGEGISKSFGSTQALKNVTITIKKGEIQGLIRQIYVFIHLRRDPEGRQRDNVPGGRKICAEWVHRRDG